MYICKAKYGTIAKTITIVLVCLFCADTIVIASPDTLGPQVGNPKTYQEMRSMMKAHPDAYQVSIDPAVPNPELEAYASKIDPSEWRMVYFAGGKGTRMGSPLPKFLIPIAGKPILQHSVDHANYLGIKSIIKIREGDKDTVKTIGPSKAKYLFIDAPIVRTLYMIRDAVNEGKFSGHVILSAGDTLMLDRNTLIAGMYNHSPPNGRQAWLTIITSRVSNPHSIPRIVRNKRGGFEMVISQSRIDSLKRDKKTIRLSDGSELSGEEVENNNEVFGNIAIFNSRFFNLASYICKFACLSENNGKHNEFRQDAYKLFSLFFKLGVRLKVFRVALAPSMDALIGINTPEDLEIARRNVAKRNFLKQRKPTVITGKTISPFMRIIEKRSIPAREISAEEFVAEVRSLAERLEPFTDIQNNLQDKGLILYADDILEQGAVVDMERILATTNVLDNSTVIVFGRMPGRAEILKKIIEASGKSIKVEVLEESDLVEKYNITDVYNNESKVLDCLVRYAASIGLNNGRLMGVIKGATAEDELDKVQSLLNTSKVPVVSFETRDGVYSFAEALNLLFRIKADPAANGRAWFRMLRPIERLSPNMQAIYENYRRMLSELSTKA